MLSCNCRMQPGQAVATMRRTAVPQAGYLPGADGLAACIMRDGEGAAQTTAGGGVFHLDKVDVGQGLQEIPRLFGDPL